MRTAFIMTSNVAKAGSRRKKLLDKIPKGVGSNATSASALLSLKIEFEKT